MLRKPAWMSVQKYGDLMLREGLAPRCKHCGSADDLTVDHIKPRVLGGDDELDNLQVLCRRCNSAKRDRPDIQWNARLYWDEQIKLDALWTAQRRGVYETLEMPHIAQWFARPWSQISGVLYTLAWVVGAGKTMAIPTLAFALNRIVRREWGPATRRVNRVLVLVKERGLRDQVAEELRKKIREYGICGRSPRVAVVDERWLFEGNVDECDVAVACVQMFFTVDSQPRVGTRRILADFPLIVFDEPHWAQDQVLGIVEEARESLCFGLTSTPINAAGESLRRYALVSLYGYQDAIESDQSLKWLPEPDESGELSPDLYDEIGAREVEIMRLGERSFLSNPNLSEIRHEKQLTPVQAVAWRVVHYMQECDRYRGQPAKAAPHRGRTPATLWYPMHGLIVVESVKVGRELVKALNADFAAQRSRYPREDGWFAEFVCSVRDDGKEIAGATTINEKHPWMYAREHKNRVNEDAARILVVVDMAREGVNNPLCGVVGIACPIRSQIEGPQRAVGRSLRAVVRREGKTVIEVPPDRLDTIRIVSHEGFGNRSFVKLAVDFVLKMEEKLADMPTIEDLIVGINLPLGGEIDDEGGLSDRERLSIIGEIGMARRLGYPIERDRIIDEYGGSFPKKRRRVADWFDLAEEQPSAAWERMGHARDLESETIVLHEDSSLMVTRQDVEHYIRHAQPDLEPFLMEYDSDPTTATLLRRLAENHANQFRPIEIAAWTTLNQIHNDLVSRVRNDLGDFWGWGGDDGEIHSLVWTAIKAVLGVPDGEVAKTGGRFDRPSAHHLLERPSQQRAMRNFVRGRLIERGACPELSRGFRIVDPFDDQEVSAS